jgi:hypothetical protein
MKRIVLMLLVLTAAAGFTAAQDEGIGLSAGLELGLGIVAAEVEFGLSPFLEYENSFFDGALDLSAALAYGLVFSDPVAQGIEMEEELAYNLSLAGTSVLSFILNNSNGFVLSPREDDSNNLEGVLSPGIKFNQTLGFGDLFARVDFPLTYVQPERGAEFEFGIDLGLGWASTFGLGIEVTEHNVILPEGVYGGIDLTASYEYGPIYAELAIGAPPEFEGISISPAFEYTFNAFTFYASLEFADINVEGADVSISPAIGVKFSF